MEDTGWLPMESAPLDGTTVLAKGYRLNVVREILGLCPGSMSKQMIGHLVD